jgi:phage-related minor tail protein
MASGSIKGITIEIGGDTTKLNKALRSVNSEVRNTQSQLREVDRALKFDPTNTDLLAQKQKLLGDRIAETKSKLETLREADKQAKAQLANGKLGEEDYRALQREITITESKLKGFQKQYDNFSVVGEKLQAVGGKMSEVGSAMTKYVTGPIVAGAAASAAAFNEVDAAMDTVAEKTGATGDVLSLLEDSVKNIATTIPTDFQTAGNAVSDVYARFKLTGDALDDLSTKFIEFSKITGTDVNTAIESTQQILSAFGMSVDDAGNLLGVFTSVSQNTGISVDELMSSLQSNGATFRDMGLSAASATTLLGNFESAGIDSDTAMTGLKRAMVNFQDQGISATDGLNGLIASLQDGEVTTQDYQSVIDIFGKRAGDAFVDMASSGRLSLDGLGTDLGNFSDVVSSTYYQTLDPADQFQVAMNQLKLVGYDAFSTLAEVLAPAIQMISDGLKNLRSWWESLSPGTKDAITKAVLIAAAIGPIILLIGKILTGIGILATVLPALAGPVGIVILIIGLVIAAIIAIWTNWDAISAALQAGWEGFISALEQMWQGLQDFFIGIWDAIVGAFNGAVGAIQAAWGAVVGFFQGIWDGIVAVFSAVATYYIGQFQAAIDGIESVWGGIVGFFSGIWGSIQGVFGSVGQWFSDTFWGAVHSIQDAFGGIGQWFEDLFNNIHIPTFHVSGGFNLDPANFQLPSIEWYKTGGIFSSPSIIGVGEAGTEAVAPISELNKYMTAQSGPTYNIYIDGIKYNDGDAMDHRITDFVDGIIMKGAMFNGNN